MSKKLQRCPACGLVMVPLAGPVDLTDCPRCDLQLGRTLILCAHCNGVGNITHYYKDLHIETQTTCPVCGGKGGQVAHQWDDVDDA